MADWIELHDDVFGHRKTRKAARKLGIPCVHLVGHLASLWCWSRDRADDDGRLPGSTAEDIATAAEWDDGTEAFCTALLDANYLEIDADGLTYIVHDHAVYNERLIASRKHERERKRAWREKQKMSLGQPGLSQGQDGLSQMSQGQDGASAGQRDKTPMSQGETLDQPTNRPTNRPYINTQGSKEVTNPPTPTATVCPDVADDRAVPDVPNRGSKRPRLAQLEQHLATCYKKRLFPLTMHATHLDRVEETLAAIERDAAVCNPDLSWFTVVTNRLRTRAVDISDGPEHAYKQVSTILGYLAEDFALKAARKTGADATEPAATWTPPSDMGVPDKSEARLRWEAEQRKAKRKTGEDSHA